MTEKKVDIGELPAYLREASMALHSGDYWPNGGRKCEAAADLLESLQPLLDKHGIEGVKQLCEAGERLPRDADGHRMAQDEFVYVATMRGYVEEWQVGLLNVGHDGRLNLKCNELSGKPYCEWRVHRDKEAAEAALQAIKETQKGDG